MIKESEERLLLQMRLNMNEAPLILVVVPVYKVEPYLEYRGPDLLEFRICFG